MTKPDDGPRRDVEAEHAAMYAAYADGTPETGGEGPASGIASQAASTANGNGNTQSDAVAQEAGQPDATDATASQAGDMPQPSVGGGPPAGSPARPRVEPLHVTVKRRLEREGRWHGRIELERNQMMADAKSAFPDKEARQAWVYGELDRMYPPLEKPIYIGISAPGETDIYRNLEAPAGAPSGTDSGQIQGLNDLPSNWPELPANASLAAEIGWVQANRLFMVEDRPGKATRVRLDQAASPAPSRASLGWLETSIRSYAKFVDVAAKVSGGDDGDEGAVMRRERRSIEEVEALLAEMMEAEDGDPG